jgi:hypothetical protein
MEDEQPSADWRTIIALLCLEAGRTMENSAQELAMCLPAESAAIETRLRIARGATDNIQSLLAAARVLHRRCMVHDQD